MSILESLNRSISNLNFKHLIKYKSLIVSVCIALVALIIGAYGIYYPAEKEIERLNSVIHKLQERKTLIAEVTSLKNKLGYYHQRLPSKNVLDWLMDRIVQEAEMSRIKIVSINPQPLKEFPPFNMVSVKVGMVGGYHQIGNLIERIENGDKFIWIDSISIEKDKLKGQIDLKVSTFYPLKKQE